MNKGESRNKRKRRLARMRAHEGMDTTKFQMTLDRGVIPIPAPDVHEHLDKAVIKETLLVPTVAGELSIAPTKRKRKQKPKPPPPVPKEVS